MNKSLSNIIRPRLNQGFSLLEVLVAVVVLAIGLLSLAALQISGIRYLSAANMDYQAMLQAVDMAERMRANPDGVAGGAYSNVSGTGSNPNCISSYCSASQMAQTDIYQWNTLNAQLLPSGAGTVTVNGNLYTITITWNVAVSFGAAPQLETFALSFSP
ncbi:MAG: type IV pilus modification protein PilV [Legionellales bacterium]|nr:type IV pilus modification protein PilV [Legionellales bacterium]